MLATVQIDIVLHTVELTPVTRRTLSLQLV